MKNLKKKKKNYCICHTKTDFYSALINQVIDYFFLIEILNLREQLHW